MCSSPSQASSPSSTALISTPAISPGPASVAAARTPPERSSRTPSSASWSVSATRRRPAAAMARYRSAGASTPSQRLRGTVKRARGGRVDEARQDGGRVETDDAPDGPGHADVRLVGRTTAEDPLVGRGHVRVRAGDDADTAVEVDPEGVLLARQL